MTDTEHSPRGSRSSADAEQHVVMSTLGSGVTQEQVMNELSNYHYYNLKQLQNECRGRKLPVSGLKQDLIGRLMRFDSVEEAAADAQKRYMTVLRVKSGVEPSGWEWIHKSLASGYIDRVKKMV